MRLEVLTPDEILFKGEINSIVLPGLDGSFGVLNNHAAMIAGLKEGPVKVEQTVGTNKPDVVGDFEGRLNAEHQNDAVFIFDIRGGVCEVKDNKVIVLAE